MPVSGLKHAFITGEFDYFGGIGIFFLRRDTEDLVSDLPRRDKREERDVALAHIGHFDGRAKSFRVQGQVGVS